VILLALVVLLAVACSRESQQTQPVTTTTEKGTSTAPPAKEVENRDKALVRIVHAIPGGPAVDVFADDTKAFTNVTYKTVTPYRELSDKLHETTPRPSSAMPGVPPYTVPSDKLHLTFRIRPVGQDTAQPLAENTEMLTIGKHYTVIALPSTEGKQPSLKVTSDNLTPGPSDKARVRLIHASPDAGELDVYAKGTDKALFAGVNFKSEVGYKEVEPMTAWLEIRPEGKKDTLATVPSVKWEAGKTYTIVVVGRAKGVPKLEAIPVEDQLGISTASRTTAPPAAANRRP